MTPATVNKLATALRAARIDVRFADLAGCELPQSVADAYAVQSELAVLAGGRPRAWKVTALAADDQRRYGSDRPVVEPGDLGMPACLDWGPIVEASDRAISSQTVGARR